MQIFDYTSFTFSKIRKFSAHPFHFSIPINGAVSLKGSFHDPKLIECDIKDENYVDGTMKI